VGDDSEKDLPDDAAPELTEERFAVNFRAAREDAGLSQGRVADEMVARGWPWHQQTVTRVETGRRMVRLGEAAALADILATSLDNLTSPTEEVVVVEQLAAWIRRAKAAWRLVAMGTSELIRARELLRVHPSVADGTQAGPGRILDAVTEARDVELLTPEGAVAQGIAQVADRTGFYTGQEVELVTIRPQSVADTGTIADALREGKSIVVDLTANPVAQDESKEILQFIYGAARVRRGIVKHEGMMKYRVLPATADPVALAIATVPASALRRTLADLLPDSEEDGTDGSH
jgi:transcriptional regulator with XRE-family HTH domain